MNIIISAVVGVALATAAMVGGVKAAQGDQQKVSSEKLAQYSSQ